MDVKVFKHTCYNFFLGKKESPGPAHESRLVPVAK